MAAVGKMKKFFFPILIIFIVGVLFSFSAQEVSANTETLTPSAPGYETNIPTQYPNSGAHWDKVDEYPTADTNTYVEVPLDNMQTDTYKLKASNIPAGSTINSVTVFVNFMSTIPTVIAYCFPALRLGTNLLYGGAFTEYTANYTLYNQTIARPGGGSWAVSDLANLQVGIRLYSGHTQGSSRCTQVYVVVDYTPPWTTCGDLITFTYKGSSVTYGTVASQGKCWMDRNLGALQKAIASNDSNAYGDLFQWGRLDDQHQTRTSGTTTTLSTTDNPGHSNFIYRMGGLCDWRSPQNNNLWQGVSGNNNPCPSGWRLPTSAELDTERLSWSSQNYIGAYNSPLRLTAGGYRDWFNAIIGLAGSEGYYWSNTVDGTDAKGMAFGGTYAAEWTLSRAYGFSVRCLLDVTTVPTVTTDIASVNLQGETATLKGTLVNRGGASSCDVRFEYRKPGESGYPNVTLWQTISADTPFSATTGAPEFIPQTVAGNTYVYRAVAKNTAGTSYGATDRQVVIYTASGGQKQFTTCQCSTATIGGCCDGCHYCPAGTVFDGSSCSNATLCGYSSWNGCSGFCQKKRDQLRCDASHNCAYDVGDEYSYLSTSGKVCSGGNEVDPSSSINCDKTINCADNACSAARYYRGCTAGAISCTETGEIAYTAWPAPLNYTISETTYKVGDTCATNQDICGYSPFNKCGGLGSPYSCQKGRDQYRCNGAGSCTQDVGDDWANVASGYVCDGGAEVALSTTKYCGYTDSNLNNCQWRRTYSSCNGSNACSGATTYSDTTCGANQATKGVASCSAVTTTNYCDFACDGSCRTGYRGCSSSGTTCEATFRAFTNCVADTACSGSTCVFGNYCAANQCRDGGGWHHKCSKWCDGSNACFNWADSTCVDHCTNSVQDCDETGIDTGGSCACNLNRACPGDCGGSDTYTITKSKFNGCCVLNNRVDELGNDIEIDYYLIAGNLTLQEEGCIQINANTALQFDSGKKINLIQPNIYILKSASNTKIIKQQF